MNDHFKTIMPGLSAKVFRTYNASITLEKELPLSISHFLGSAEQARAMAIGLDIEHGPMQLRTQVARQMGR